MIRAGQIAREKAREERENRGKFDDFADFWVDCKVEMVWKGKIHLQHNKFTDQNQQNIIKTHKSQEIFLGLFLWGFSD